jgi:hypothetical protein
VVNETVTVLRERIQSLLRERDEALVKLERANALLDMIRSESESVNGRYNHPDQLEQAVRQAFDRIRSHLSGTSDTNPRI